MTLIKITHAGKTVEIQTQFINAINLMNTIEVAIEKIKENKIGYEQTI